MAPHDVVRFDRWAKSYDHSIGQRFLFVPVHKRLLDVVASACKGDPPRSIVDVGCGTGRLLRAAGERWPGALLSGFDPAPNMLEEARGLTPTAAFTVAPAEFFPSPTGRSISFSPASRFTTGKTRQKGYGRRRGCCAPAAFSALPITSFCPRG